MKKLKYILSILVILVVASCGSKKSEVETVDVVLDWYPNALHTFLYTAIEKGYFEEEGIKVNIHFPSNASDPITLTAGKKADIGIYYPHHLIMARANENIPIKSIGALTQEPLNVVIALKEKNIHSPKDLVGKKVGYSGGGLAESSLKTMIEFDGGDPSKLELVDVGFELLTAMITNQVDATTGNVVNHEVPVMIDKGFEIDYFGTTEYGMPKYYEVVFVANEEVIKDRHDVFVKFLKASKRGFEDVLKDPDAAIDLLLAKQEADQFPLTRNVEKQGLDILLPVMQENNKPFLSQDKNLWQENIDWLYEKGIINKKVDAKDMYIDLIK